jgi:DNA-directed RNA polymerase specialized sigma24 family protein
VLQDTALDPLQQAQQLIQLNRIYGVLDQLDDLSREVVLLRYVEDLSFDEIALVI